MYTIKQAASRSGVSVPLLRAWERRYGIVQPARTASGYRLYDDASILRLQAMRRLVEDGWTPSLAAVHIRDGDEDTVATILREAAAAGSAETAADEAGTATREELAGAFVDAARTMDDDRLEAILDEMFGRGSFERVTGEHVLPAMVAVGDGWAAGRLDVAAEHAASGAVARRLGMALLAAGRPANGRGSILVGLPPGARHELGALAFATAARRAGLPVQYLGADLPVENWVEAARQTAAAAAVIGVVMEGDVESAVAIAEALRAARPDIVIAFGGHAAERVASYDPDRDLHLAPELAASVEQVRAAVSGS
jgi:DNA-binding transcriptional MerR regulator/methylmalonyl-CoA mutase cobalamin-binding subunit